LEDITFIITWKITLREYYYHEDMKQKKL